MHGAWLWVMFLAAMAFVWALRSLLRRTTPDEPEEPRQPMCQICGTAPATRRLPVIARSWLESLNPLRSLYGSAHLYRRSEDNYSALVVCEAHCELYASFMDEGLAKVRNLNAEHAAQMDRHISDLRTGVLLERTRRYVAGEGALEHAPVLQLTAHPDDEVTEQVAISTQTTSGKSLNGAAAN